MSITVIVPTVGRPSLWATLTSFAPDLHEGDAVIVMSDGDDHWVEELVAEFAMLYPVCEWTYAFEMETGGWGHQLRNVALTHYVRTSHVWTIDDDDVALPGALDLLREHEKPDGWVIFKMVFGQGHHAEGVLVWVWPQITVGNIGTPMFFAPLTNARFGLSYTGDYDYACQLRDELGEPEWREDVIALIRP